MDGRLDARTKRAVEAARCTLAVQPQPTPEEDAAPEEIAEAEAAAESFPVVRNILVGTARVDVTPRGLTPEEEEKVRHDEVLWDVAAASITKHMI